MIDINKVCKQQNNKGFRCKKKGVVLLLTLFAILFMAIIMTAYMETMTIETKIMRNHKASTEAFYIAEAGFQSGVRYILDNIVGDSDWSDNNSTVYSNISFGDGVYSVVLANGGTNYIDVESTGTINGVTRSIGQTITNETGVPEAYDDALYTEGSITTTGASNLGVTGTETQSGIELPVVVFASYEAIADTVIAGDKTFTIGTYSGIYYVTGDVTIDSDVTINGAIISEGGISARNNSNIIINSALPNPAIVANDEISFRSTTNSTITGLVFSGADATGNFNAQSADTLTVNGTIISGGGIIFRNSSDVTVTYDGSILTNLPLYISNGATPGVILSAWQENP